MHGPAAGTPSVQTTSAARVHQIPPISTRRNLRFLGSFSSGPPHRKPAANHDEPYGASDISVHQDPEPPISIRCPVGPLASQTSQTRTIYEWEQMIKPTVCVILEQANVRVQLEEEEQAVGHANEESCDAAYLNRHWAISATAILPIIYPVPT